MKAQRANSRNEDLLRAAAALFAQQGFMATSMRDIAKAVDMLPGSIYYHFQSKDDLLLTIYEAGVSQITDEFTLAIAGYEDPWERLAAGMAALVRAVTDESSFTRVIFKVMPQDVPKYRAELVTFRDAFESAFRKLVGDLPLSEDVDPHLLRLMLLGAGNHAQLWFSQSGDRSPEEVGRAFCRFVRASCERTE